MRSTAVEPATNRISESSVFIRVHPCSSVSPAFGQLRARRLPPRRLKNAIPILRPPFRFLRRRRRAFTGLRHSPDLVLEEAEAALQDAAAHAGITAGSRTSWQTPSESCGQDHELMKAFPARGASAGRAVVCARQIGRRRRVGRRVARGRMFAGGGYPVVAPGGEAWAYPYREPGRRWRVRGRRIAAGSRRVRVQVDGTGRPGAWPRVGTRFPRAYMHWR